MITTVVLNPALDKIYFVDDFEPGKMYRVQETIKSAGGKGVNVARVAKILGEDTTTIGFKGGDTGNWIETQLINLGVCTAFVEVEGETRTNNNIIDRVKNTETEVLELGPVITGDDMGKFLAVYKDALKSTKVVVLSGGLPQGMPMDYYKTLIEVANSYDVPVILDASGEVLREGMKAKPYMIKPNLRELGNLVQRELTGGSDVLAACRDIVSTGVEIVVVSMGDRGAILVTKGIAVRVKVPVVNVVNTIGSGDAMVAGFAAGLAGGKEPEESLRLAAACGVSNAGFVEIGIVDKQKVDELKDNMEIERLM